MKQLDAAMTGQESPGLLRRVLTALGGALGGGLLGKSAHDHTKQLTGGDEYWRRAVAAQLGWPRRRPSEEPGNQAPRRFRGEGGKDGKYHDPGTARPIPQTAGEVGG
jgi:hypothetical protein